MCSTALSRFLVTLATICVLRALIPRRAVLVVLTGLGKALSDLMQKPASISRLLNAIVTCLGMNPQDWDVTPEAPGSYLRMSRLLKFLGLDRSMVTDPSILTDYLVMKDSKFEKPEYYVYGAEFVGGTSLFVIHGQAHKEKRRMLGKGMTAGFYQDQVSIAWSKMHLLASQLSSQLENNQASSVLELSSWCYRALLDTFGKAAFDYEFNTLSDGGERSEIFETFWSWTEDTSTPFKYLFHRLLALTLPTRIIYRLPLPEIVVQKTTKQLLAKICTKIIEDRTGQNKKLTDDTKRHDFLNTILEASESSSEAVAHMNTFIFGSQHTLSATLPLLLHYLARYPQVQGQLREEIYAHISSPNAELTPAHLRVMPYLNAVVMEILRLEPPVRSIPRLASQPVEIGGTRIAAGEEVLSLTRTIHLREDLWGDDAREFKPERWVQDLCGNGGAKQKNSFLPFSHGPRNCIGKEYALIQLKVMLLGLVGNFHFAPVGGTGPPRLSTPTPLNFMTYTRTVKGRLHLRVQRLEEWGNLTIA